MTKKQSQTKKQKKSRKQLTAEELEQQSGEELPDRKAMSLLPMPDPTGPSMLPPIVPEETPE